MLGMTVVQRLCCQQRRRPTKRSNIWLRTPCTCLCCQGIATLRGNDSHSSEAGLRLTLCTFRAYYDGRLLLTNRSRGGPNDVLDDPLETVRRLLGPTVSTSTWSVDTRHAARIARYVSYVVRRLDMLMGREA